MEVTLLLGNILSPIAYVLGLIMNGIYAFFSIFHIQNIALSIFVFTFITKSLMLPLTIKQQKFSKLSSRMNPEVQKIQAKYKGKKDAESLRKQQLETSAVYQKYGASPTSGCLPLLISLPILFALYQVINNIPHYVTIVGNQYTTVANAVNGNQGLLAQVAAVTGVDPAKLTDNKTIIALLAKFKTVDWNNLFVGVPEAAQHAIDYIKNVNNFFGLSVTNNPSWKSWTVIIPFLSMALQYIQSKQITYVNKTNSKDNPTANAMSSMNVVMPIMSGFFCFILPIGVGLYWIANSVYSIIQQYFVNKYLNSMDIDELVEKSEAKASKKFSKSISTGTTMQDIAKRQTRYIESTVTEKAKDQVENKDNAEKPDNNEAPAAEVKAAPKSISEIANLLKSRNEKGDK